MDEEHRCASGVGEPVTHPQDDLADVDPLVGEALEHLGAAHPPTLPHPLRPGGPRAPPSSPIPVHPPAQTPTYPAVLVVIAPPTGW
ncbi:hypothetical protein GCM10009633_03340 [Janibacter melonis]